MGLEVALLATAAVATGASIYSSQEAAGAQRQAAKLQQQQMDLQAARQSRSVVQQARVAQANATQNANNQGASNSSAYQGGTGSIQSQMGGNLSFLDQYNSLSDQSSHELGKASQFAAESNTWGAVAGLSETAYANAPRINRIFNGSSRSSGAGSAGQPSYSPGDLFNANGTG